MADEPERSFVVRTEGRPSILRVRRPGPVTTVYIARPAESARGALTPAGATRAEALADLLGDVALAAVFHDADAPGAQATAAPAAARAGLEALPWPPEGRRAAVAAHEGLALLAVVAREEIASLLVELGGPAVERALIPAWQHDTLLTLKVRALGQEARLERRKYGPRSRPAP